jgi:Dirigent-like protein
MRKILILSGLAAIALAGHASAQSTPAQLQLVAVEQGCHGVDVGRHGDSLGDETYCRATLRHAGRVHWDCVYLGAESRGEDCTAHAELSGGTLQMAGVLSHTSTRSTWAVTGGTGTYAAARGTAALRQLSATRTAVTIALQP